MEREPADAPVRVRCAQCESWFEVNSWPQYVHDHPSRLCPQCEPPDAVAPSEEKMAIRSVCQIPFRREDGKKYCSPECAKIAGQRLGRIVSKRGIRNDLRQSGLTNSWFTPMPLGRAETEEDDYGEDAFS
jgi:hypothetical protein